jgi:hypothetical protein
MLFLMVCLVAGCTTLQPVTGTTADVRQRIASGELLKRGDCVLILTDDGRTHYFKVTSVSATTLEGGRQAILIEQIASIQKRKLDLGKTVVAVGLTVVVAAAVVVVAAASSVGAHRSPVGRIPRRSARFAQPVPPPLPASPQIQNCDENDGHGAPALRCSR